MHHFETLHQSLVRPIIICVSWFSLSVVLFQGTLQHHGFRKIVSFDRPAPARKRITLSFKITTSTSCKKNYKIHESFEKTNKQTLCFKYKWIENWMKDAGCSDSCPLTGGSGGSAALLIESLVKWREHWPCTLQLHWACDAIKWLIWARAVRRDVTVMIWVFSSWRQLQVGGVLMTCTIITADGTKQIRTVFVCGWHRRSPRAPPTLPVIFTYSFIPHSLSHSLS